MKVIKPILTLLFLHQMTAQCFGQNVNVDSIKISYVDFSEMRFASESPTEFDTYQDLQRKIIIKNSDTISLILDEMALFKKPNLVKNLEGDMDLDQPDTYAKIIIYDKAKKDVIYMDQTVGGPLKLNGELLYSAPAFRWLIHGIIKYRDPKFD